MRTNETESQLNIRAAQDREITENAYAELASAIGASSEKKSYKPGVGDRTVQAIRRCLAYYKAEAGEVPESVVSHDSPVQENPDGTSMYHGEEEKIEYCCRPSGIMHRRVRLDEKWYRNTFGPLLGHRKDGEPVALIPTGFRGYFYVDPDSRHMIRVNRKTAEDLAPEAVFFYRALPTERLTLKDLLSFMLRTLNGRDYVAVFLAALAATLIGLLPAWANNLAFGTVIPAGLTSLIVPIGALLVGVAVSTVLINACRNLFINRMSQKMGVYMDAAVYARLLTLPSSFFRKYNSGDLAMRVSGLKALSQQMVQALLGAGLTSILSLIYLIQIFNFTPVLMLPALGIVVLQGAFMWLATAVTIRYERKKVDADALKSGVETSLLNGIRKIKLAGAENRAFAKWAETYATYLKPAYNRPAILQALPAIVTVIGLLGTILIYGIAAESNIDMPEFMAFSVAYGQMSVAMLTAAGIAGQVIQIHPMIELCRPLMDEVPELSPEKDVVDRLSGSIHVEHMSFRYDDKSPYVLKDFSLHIRPGEYVAVVGRSGCGKSTLVRLLLGFEKPEKGSVYYDSHDIQRMDLRSLRRHIGTVLQNGKLFTGNIFYNIIISSPDSTEEDAWEAAEASGIADDIRAMPMGMRTLITAGGSGLSGGQRQRLMIARAICGKPRILILDEATSALDNVTQKHVSDSLDRLNCTRVVMAHRLSTIKNCNRIICLDQGRVVEEGTYQELIEKNGFFAELVRLQQL